jgi:hypothetical protein
MSTLATLADIEARIGRTIGDPAAVPDDPARIQAQAVLDDTEGAALTVMGMTDWPDPEVPLDVVRVICARTIRSLTNPDQLRSETIGGYSYTLAGDGDAAVGAGFTTEEKRTLRTYGMYTPIYSVQMGLG